MKGSISRRSLLAGAGYVAAGSVAGQMLASLANAQQTQGSAALCMTMMFMQGAKARFDSAKYVKKHLPMLRDVYGDSVERIELRTTTGSAMGVPSPILATSALWITDVQGFSQKLAANADRINHDLDSMVKANRQVQIDRVALELGEARAEVPSNSQVFSLFYPAAPEEKSAAAPAPSFDPAYFVDVYLPKLYSLYGSNAVRRLEATLGMDQGGQKAAQVGAYHLMIRDRGEYDSKSNGVFSDMQKDAGKFTTIFPILADMRVTAIA